MDVVVVERPTPARCPYCMDGLSGATSTCAGCGTALHLGCRASLGRCPTLGCAATTEVPRPTPETRPVGRAGPGPALGALLAAVGATVGITSALLAAKLLHEDMAFVAGLVVAVGLAGAGNQAGLRLGDRFMAWRRRREEAALAALLERELRDAERRAEAERVARTGPVPVRPWLADRQALLVGCAGLAASVSLASCFRGSDGDMVLVAGLALTGVAVALTPRGVGR